MKSVDQLYSDALLIMTGGGEKIINEEIYMRMMQSIYKYGVIFILAYLIYWTMSPGDFFEIFMSLLISIAFFYLIIIPLNEMTLDVKLQEEGL